MAKSEGGEKTLLRQIEELKSENDSLKEKTERLAIINEIYRIISSSLDTNEIYDAFAKDVKRLIDYDRLSLVSVGNANNLEIVTYAENTKSMLGYDEVIPIKGTVFDLIFKAKKPLLKESGESVYANKTLDEALLKGGIRSVVIVPFFSKKAVTGAFSIGSSTAIYTKRDIDVLNDIGRQLAIAIENANLYNEIKTAYEDVKNLEELKSDIISNVSHEIKTPITVTTMAINLLAEEEDEDTRKELKDVAVQSLARQERIVDDLFTATKLRKHKISLDLEPIDISHAITVVYGEAKSLAENKKVKISFKLEDGLPKVNADFEMVKHILSNLVNNAIKFNKEGGKVIIRGSMKDDRVLICVSDTGIGIPDSKVERIFSPLYQVEASTTRRYEGIGLGLTIAKDLVEAHGGKIMARSKVGKGTTVCFTLPPVLGKGE